MKSSSQRLAASHLLTVVLIAACSTANREPGPTVVQPGAPGEAGRTVTAGELTEGRQTRHTDADVRFMRRMIEHHAQALEMTSLASTRSRSEEIHLLARRIDLSQKDELRVMERWLTERGEELPSPDAHHGHHGGGGHHEQMPGMLTPEELARLAKATGAEFDRLFLEFMIHHHEGALIMVEELFSGEGAGQDGEIFQFASHVAADQRIEIARMRRMLAAGR